jgi:uncharacterized membrane protein YuzA (DUF378 family)
MTRINALAALVLVAAGLNVGLAGMFDYNLAADVFSARLQDIAAVVVGIAALVAIADRFGWTRA